VDRRATITSKKSCIYSSNFLAVGSKLSALHLIAYSIGL